MNIKALGIDLSDTGTELVFSGTSEALSFPTAIGKEKDKEEWTVGEEAYKSLLGGTGMITDRLLTLTSKNGTATLYGIKYKGKELLKRFFQTIIDIGVNAYGGGYPEEIVISIPKLDADIVDQIISCFVDLGYIKTHIHVISRCESFISYTMSKNRDIWNNQVGLFYLADHELTYYELKVHRGYKNIMVIADALESLDSFDSSVLRTTTGAKLGDQILFSMAQRMIGKRLFSTVFLGGGGFEQLDDWGESFKKYICNSNRKVYYEQHIFALGASFRATDFMNQNHNPGFTCICDGRLSSTVSIHVIKNQKEIELPLAKAGDSWYTLKKELRVIADGKAQIELSVLPVHINKKKTVKIPLDFIPVREAKTLRIDLKTRFKDSRTMVLDIQDAGFGEIIPSSNAHVVKEVDLWD